MVSHLNHPLRFLLHAFRRAQYTLSAAHGMPFTDGLLERQQRLSDMDRHIFKSSWTAFRWILRLLPILAALQSFWPIYSETQLFLGKQSELEQFANAFWPAMLPLVQLTVLAVFLGLAFAFLIDWRVFIWQTWTHRSTIKCSRSCPSAVQTRCSFLNRCRNISVNFKLP